MGTPTTHVNPSARRVEARITVARLASTLVNPSCHCAEHPAVDTPSATHVNPSARRLEDRITVAQYAFTLVNPSAHCTDHPTVGTPPATSHVDPSVLSLALHVESLSDD